MIASIPFDSIAKIEVYDNKSKKTLAQIKQETGADYIINGSLFTKQFHPMGLVVSNGQVISDAKGVYGFGFDGNKVYFSYDNIVKCDNYISAYPILLSNGIQAFGSVPAGLEGDRGRSGIGMTNNSFVLICEADKQGNSDFTLSEFAQEFINAGCSFAINLDGGGSSQCDFNGKKISSSRIVRNFVLVYMKKKEGDNNSKMKVYISPSNQTENIYYSGKHNESEICRKIGKSLVYALTRQGIEYKITSDGMLMSEYIPESNEYSPDFHIAIHTNAGGINARGVVCLIPGTGGNAEKLAREIVEEFAGIQPTNRAEKISVRNLPELTKTIAPAVLVECDFHDNIDGENFILSNIDNIAESITKAVCNVKKIAYSAPVSESPAIPDWYNLSNPLYTSIEQISEYWREDVNDLISIGAIQGDGVNQISIRREALQAVIIAYRAMKGAEIIWKKS